MSTTTPELITAPVMLRGGAAMRVLMKIARNPEATLAVVLVLGAVGSGLFVSSDVLTVGNMTLLMQAMVPQLAVGLGVSIALYAGIADLSIGSIMLVGAIMFALATHTIDGVVVPVLIGVGVASLVGFLNSILVVGFRVDPIVATLATLLGIQGIAFVLGGDVSQVSNAFDWDLFVSKQVGDFPVLFLVLVVLYGIATVFMKKTRTGRHLLAVGAGPLSARRLGIKVGRIQLWCLVLCAVAAGLGGVLAAGIVGAAPITLGAQDVFLVYSGILLGGFSIARGGVGSPLGGILGIATLSLMLNVLSNASVTAGWQDVAIGIMLLIAVALDRLRYGAYSPTTPQ
jgi:ribose transport system permease protein